MALILDVDEIALATLDAAIEAAGVAVAVPLAPTAPEGRVDEEERTVILGVDVTPVFSVPRRKLGMDLAGCGLPPLAVHELEVFNLGVLVSFNDAVLDVVEPAVPGLWALPCWAAEGLSDVRVEVDSCVPELPVDAAERAGLDRPLDSEARLLVESVGRRTGVPARRGDSL